ncbi:hypothetical protein STABA_v1c02470 [Spiroplasma tabanidicola]|uniref:Uncharacterized protein n=2 Tax=Spiroplasma tabanidicola TaxID=324079 RepID=A0A6I6CCC1_9MOLU|nr:hypothetical protein STABA_v1c02470 [Spiroplasma tabanidicola]
MMVANDNYKNFYEFFYLDKGIGDYMKHLLLIITSFMVVSIAAGEPAVMILDNNKGEENNTENLDNNNDQDNQTSIINLKKVVKVRSFKDLKKPTKENLLDYVKQYNTKLNIDEVEVKDFVVEKDKVGYATINTKDGSKVYIGSVKISFTVYQYVHTDFKLQKTRKETEPEEFETRATIRLNSYEDIAITNFDSLGDYVENMPSVFNYDTNKLKVTFNKEQKSIRVLAKALTETELRVEVSSLDGIAQDEIIVNIKPDHIAFELEEDNIKLELKGEQRVNITNWSALINDQNQPDPDLIEVNYKNVVDVSIDTTSEQKAIVIKSNGNYIDDMINVVIYSKDKETYRIIGVSLISDNNNRFKLDEAYFDVLVNTEFKIKVHKSNLSDVQPSLNKISDPDAVEFIKFDDQEISWNYIIFRTKKEKENVKITLNSVALPNAQDSQTVIVNVKPTRIDFKLETTYVLMNVGETRKVKITNFDDLIDKKNYPKVQSWTNHNEFKVTLSEDDKSIIIESLNTSKPINDRIHLKSDTGAEAFVEVKCIVPEVSFQLENPYNMDLILNSGTENVKKLKIKNYDNLKYEQNMPKDFDLNINGKQLSLDEKNNILKTEIDKVNKQLVITAISEKGYSNVNLTIKSENGSQMSYLLDIVKPIKLEDINKDAISVVENDETSILTALRLANTNTDSNPVSEDVASINEVAWNMLKVDDISYNRARISVNLDINGKPITRWFTGEPIYFKFTPGNYEIDDVYLSTSLVDEYSSHSESKSESFSEEKTYILPDSIDKLSKVYTNIKLTFNSYLAYTPNDYNPPLSDADLLKNEKGIISVALKLGNNSTNVEIDKIDAEFPIKDDVTGITKAINSFDISFDGNSVKLKLKSYAYAYRKGGAWGALPRVDAQAKVELLKAELTV